MIAAPTIITLVDKNQDTTIFLDINEEEEEENNIKKTSKELKVLYSTDLSIFFRKTQKRLNVVFHSKNYVSEYIGITTPPPKFLF